MQIDGYKDRREDIYKYIRTFREIEGEREREGRGEKGTETVNGVCERERERGRDNKEI